MRFASAAVIISLFLSLSAQADIKAGFTGRVIDRFGKYTDSDDHSLAQDNWVFLEQKAQFDKHWSLKAQGYGYAGTSKVELIQAQDNVSAKSQIAEVWPGDVYLEGSYGSMLMKFGYQQLPWQEGFALSYTNFINARDERESVFEGADQIFRSNLAANLIYSGDHLSIQGIYMPFSQHDIAPPFSRWGAAAQVALLPGQTAQVNSPSETSLSNEHGARATWAGEGFDLSVFYAHLRDRQLVYSVSSQSSLSNLVLDGEQAFITPVGATASVRVQDYILRLEALDIQARQYNVVSTSGIGTQSFAERAFTLGLDSPTWEHFSFSTQESASILDHTVTGLVRNKTVYQTFGAINYALPKERNLKLTAVYVSDKTFLSRLGFAWPLSKRVECMVAFDELTGSTSSQGAAVKDMSELFVQLNQAF